MSAVDSLLGRTTLVRQLSTSYTGPDLKTVDSLHGGLNCGPTVLTMAITYWASQQQTKAGAPTIDKLGFANFVRSHAFTPASDNYYHPDRKNPGTGTNFGLDDSTTGVNSRELLGKFGLQINQIDSDPKAGLDALKKSLGDGHPVALLVDNNEYATEGKSASTIYGGMDGALTKDHVILVTAYDPDAHVFYVDDPLATQADDQISESELTDAATNTTSSPGHWYGGAIYPATKQ
jgi:hypothetical protein